MKTAISVPDQLFREAERHARRTGKSRSELYSQAVAEYLARHNPDEITEMVNKVVASVSKEDRRFEQAAARKALKRVDW